MWLLSFESIENQFGTGESLDYPNVLCFKSLEAFHAAVREAAPVLRANPQLRSVSLAPSQCIEVIPAHSEREGSLSQKLISGTAYNGDARRAYEAVARNLAVVRLEVLLDGDEALVTARIAEDCLFAGWVELIVQLDKEIRL